jgi:putative PEP-CTERM system TPR-repeat lipoprotein
LHAFKMPSRFRLNRLLVACCCGLLLSACDRNVPPEELLSNARAAIAEKDYQTASIQLKNALQQDPDNGAARFELGRTHLQTGDMASAVKELKRALDLNHDQNEVAPLLARAMVETGEFQDVVTRFASMQISTPAAEADVKAALGYALMATRNLEGAAKSFDAAIAIDPGHAYASVGKARLLAVTRDTDGAGALLAKVLASGKAGHDAWLLDAELKASKGQVEPALASYRKVYEIKPDATRARFIVISTLANESRFDEARKELDAFRKAVPNAPEANYLEGLLLVKERKFTEARAVLNKTLANAPDYVPALGLAALTEAQLNSNTVAEQHAEKVMALGGDSLFIRKILIGIYLKTGRVAKAQQMIEPMLKAGEQNADVQALAGQILLMSGDAAAAQKAFARSADLKPDDAASQSRLGLSKLAAGDRAGGISALENAVRLDADDTRSDTLLIVAHFRNGDADSALAAIDALEKKKPGDPMTSNLRGTAYLLKKDMDQARANFSKALEIDPGFFPAASNLARLDLMAGKTADAEGRLRSVLAESPQHPDALLALAGLKASSKDGAKEALSLLQQAVQGNPKLVAPRAALVQFHTTSGEPKKALEAASDAAQAIPDDPKILELLTSAQAQVGDLDAAILTRNKLVARDPSDATQLLRLAAAQMLAKRTSEAIQSTRKALSIAPQSLEAQKMLIAIHTSQNAIDDAIKVARDVQRQQPRAAIGYSLEGELMAKAGKYAAAVKPYQEALSREPSAANVIRLHAALDRSGNTREATALSDKWIKEKPADNTVPLYLAEIALAQKRYEDAETRYAALLKRAPKDSMVLNNLAWLAAQRKESSKAMDYAAKAYEAAPESSAVLDTYGVILFDAGETERGLTMMRQALAKSPGAHEVRMNLVQRLAKAGMKAEARKELEPLVALGDRYARASEVAALMKNL